MKDASGKILDYLQGKLSTDDEKQLFTEMAYDEELRSQFRSFTAIDKSVKSSAASFSVPGGVTENIYKGIGLSMPFESAPAKSPAGKAMFPGWKWFIVSGISVIAFVLGLLMNPVIFGDEEQPAMAERNVVPKISSEEIETDDKIELDINSLAKIEDNEAGTAASAGVSEDNEEQKQAVSETQESAKKAKPETKLYPIRKITNANVGYNSDMLDMSTNGIPRSSGIFSKKSNNNGDNEISVSEDKSTGISIEFKGSAAWFVSEPRIAPSKYSPLHNLSLSGFYGINENLKIGLEVKQETFYLEYRGTEDRTDFNYYQQPNYTTFSPTLRYNPLNFKKIDPFVQIGAGVNKGGYVVKPAAGVEYKAYADLSFVLGMEYDHFWYFHQNNWFNTSKFGINYGIIYKF